MIKSSAIKLIGLLLLATVLTANAVTDKQKAGMEERIKPVGSLCIEGDSSCGGAVVAAGGEAKSGEDVYNSSCMACHASGAAGAPILGDVAGWAPRIDKGIEALYSSAIEGFNGMPAKGLCMSCSDDELKATVDYMIEKSQ